MYLTNATSCAMIDPSIGRIPFSHLSARHNDKGLLIVLQAFYDASGHLNAAQDRFITLAGLIANKPVWDKFEPEWNETLERFGCPRSDYETGAEAIGPRYFHSREAYPRKGGYADWNWERVHALDAKLINIIFEFAARDQSDSGRIWPFSCTVSKDGYKAAMGHVRALPPPEFFCVNNGLLAALDHPDFRDGTELYFDRGNKKNEPYWNEVDALIDSKNPKRPGWAKYVVSCTKVSDSRAVSAIQAADILAWSANRYFSRGVGSVGSLRLFMLAIGTKLFHSYYDQAGIESIYDDNGQLRPGAKVPAPQIRAGLGPTKNS